MAHAHVHAAVHAASSRFEQRGSIQTLSLVKALIHTRESWLRLLAKAMGCMINPRAGPCVEEDFLEWNFSTASLC
jgi:hypothetical protein